MSDDALVPSNLQIELALSKSLKAKALLKAITKVDLYKRKLERKFLKECLQTLKNQGITADGNR